MPCPWIALQNRNLVSAGDGGHGMPGVGKSYRMLEEGNRRYARGQQENQVTQPVIGQSIRSRWQKLLKGDITGRLSQGLSTVDILIVTEPL